MAHFHRFELACDRCKLVHPRTSSTVAWVRELAALRSWRYLRIAAPGRPGVDLCSTCNYTRQRLSYAERREFDRQLLEAMRKGRGSSFKSTAATAPLPSTTPSAENPPKRRPTWPFLRINATAR